MNSDIYNNGTYAAKHPGWHSEDSDWKASHLVSLLDSATLVQMAASGISVAEIGCGFGGVLAAVSRRLRNLGIECRATGFDPSSQAIEEARRQHPEADFRVLDYRGVCGDYDLGLVVDVLEHVEEPLSLLLAARRRFRWLLLHIPLDENLYNRGQWGRDFSRHFLEGCGHIRAFTRASAFALLGAGGLRVVAWKYTPWGLELYQRICAGRRSAPVVRLVRLLGMRWCPNLSVRIAGGASLATLCVPKDVHGF